MSHFTVMVIGKDPEALLAPYQENNMDDCPQEYLEFSVKYTFEEAKKEWEKVEANGEYHYDTLEECMEDYHGYTFDEKENAFGYWHNPNTKWDWYQVGGRWAGYFKMKEGAEGKAGSSGFFGEPAEEGRADELLKGAIDIEGMKKDSEESFAKTYDYVHSVIDGIDTSDFKNWKEFLKMRDNEEITTEQARGMYHAQPVVEKFRKASMTEEGRKMLGFFSNVEEYLVPRDEYLKRGRNSAITPFAFLSEEHGWQEQGSMGWWGIVSDEKESEDWNSQFMSMFESLPDDTPITMVDCHI